MGRYLKKGINMAKQFVRKVVSEKAFNPDEIYLHSNGDMYVDTKQATVGILINGKFKSFNTMSEDDIVQLIKDNSLTNEDVIPLIKSNSLNEATVVQLIKDNSLTNEAVIQLITDNSLTEERVIELIKENTKQPEEPAEPTGE